MKSRSGLTILVILVLLVLVAVLYLRGSSANLSGVFRRQEAGLPLDLQRLIPPAWNPLPEKSLQCSFDDDPELEWLIVYKYNQVPLPAPLGKPGAQLSMGPYGAVIYDARAEAVRESATPGPYRPTELVPYRLLPDFYAGKGQGYLGETDVQIGYDVKLASPNCQAKEINVFGFGNGGLPTRLSIFRWGNPASGYQAAHFIGNARVTADVQPTAAGQISTVTTYNRLENHRSLLCDVQTYDRYGAAGALGFVPDTAGRSVDFCYGAPDDPAYPEGVVVAALRNGTPPPLADAALNANSYLLSNAAAPPELALRDPGRAPTPILAVGNPSSVNPDPAAGAWCTPEQVVGVAAQTWWCGRERTQVATTVRVGDQVRRAVWTLITLTPARVNAGIHWRVEQVALE